jgi:hypothetical protein
MPFGVRYGAGRDKQRREAAVGEKGDAPSPPPSLPAPAKATAAELAAGRAKRQAYEARRRAYTEAWHRQLAGLGDEPADGPDQAGAAPQHGRARKPRAGGTVHDPRQGRFAV